MADATSRREKLAGVGEKLLFDRLVKFNDVLKKRLDLFIKELQTGGMKAFGPAFVRQSFATAGATIREGFNLGVDLIKNTLPPVISKSIVTPIVNAQRKIAETTAQAIGGSGTLVGATLIKAFKEGSTRQADATLQLSKATDKLLQFQRENQTQTINVNVTGTINDEFGRQIGQFNRRRQ